MVRLVVYVNYKVHKWNISVNVAIIERMQDTKFRSIRVPLNHMMLKVLVFHFQHFKMLIICLTFFC